MMHDMCIAVPNCFGIAIGGIQVHLILKFADTGLWNRGPKAELLGSVHQDPERTGAEPVGEYEASLYKRTKVGTLLAVAHARFLVESYVHFASATLVEVCQWIAESRRRGAGRPAGWPCRWHCGRCTKRPFYKSGTEMSERDGLL